MAYQILDALRTLYQQASDERRSWYYITEERANAVCDAMNYGALELMRDEWWNVVQTDGKFRVLTCRKEDARPLPR